MVLNQPPPPRGRILLSAIVAVLLLAGSIALALRALDREPDGVAGGASNPGAGSASTPAASSAADVGDAGSSVDADAAGSSVSSSSASSSSSSSDSSRSGSGEGSRSSSTDAQGAQVDSGDSSAARSSTDRLGPAGLADSASASAAAPPVPLAADLRAASALEEDGLTQAAAVAFAALADATEQTPATRALAAQAAARLVLASGDPDGALALLDRAPADPAAPEAHFLRGEAHAAAGRTDEAVAAFEAYAGARPAMADEAALAAGEALAAAERPAAAAAAFERALAAASTPALAALAGIRAGNAWLDAEDPAAALVAYRAAEGVARADAERAQALAGQVAAHLAADDEPAAMDVRRTLVAALPASAPARVSLDRLRAAGERPVPLVEARVLQAHGEAAAALAVVESALEPAPPVPTGPTSRSNAISSPTTPSTTNAPATTTAMPTITAPPPADAAALIVLAVELELALDRPAAALARADAFLEGSPDAAVAADLSFARTRALRAMGRTDEEIEALAEVAAAYPRAADDVAFEAMFRRAILIEQRDGEVAGGAAWIAAFEQDPANRRAGDAGFRAGWLAYVGGRRDAATARWEAVAERAADELSRARAHYWLANLAEDRDQTTTVDAHLRAARTFDSYGWYGLRAAERLGQRPLVPAAEDPARSADIAEAAEVADAARDPSTMQASGAEESTDVARDAAIAPAIDAWLATWAGASPGAVAAARDRVRAQSELQRAAAYLALGRRRAALRAAVSARTEALSRPADLAAVALEAQAMGLHDVALGAATFLLRQAPGPVMVEAPHALWRIAYPDPWPELTVQATSPVELDPALLLALMRQESRFEPTAQSSAGARGLAQVMPGTGEGIAAQLREPGFSHDDLFRPSVSLRFGAHYIAQQLDRFDGQPGPALAAYNGGPSNAARWWPEARGDVDRLVETIDFRETRAYLRLVLTNYAIYQVLEGAP